jgi:hypothetical protein
MAHLENSNRKKPGLKKIVQVQTATIPMPSLWQEAVRLDIDSPRCPEKQAVNDLNQHSITYRKQRLLPRAHSTIAGPISFPFV